MARFFMLIFALEVIVTVLALISCLAAERGQVRALPRTVWVFVILLLPLIGSIIYFLAGRPVRMRMPGNRRRAGTRFPESSRPQRPVAPDDDPEFLRSLNKPLTSADEELLRRWEEDLRKRDDTPPTDS